jgi:hypothetical protein
MSMDRSGTTIRPLYETGAVFAKGAGAVTEYSSHSPKRSVPLSTSKPEQKPSC